MKISLINYLHLIIWPHWVGTRSLQPVTDFVFAYLIHYPLYLPVSYSLCANDNFFFKSRGHKHLIPMKNRMSYT